ncbi:hypothetical protein [Curvivirga sp.]|uniref:hypothetical protein n=1 Tax=Curvivirga sp. TaxID=2856848 RepID=UPI003B58D55D
MAKDKKNKQNDDQKQNSFAKRFMLWIAMPVTSLIFFSTAIVIAGGMIPTGVAYFVDKSEGKYATRTVGYMNIAGAIYVCMDMWSSGDNTVERALTLLSDPLNWLIMFGTAGAGWIIYFMLPPVVFSYLHAYSLIRNKKIKEQQDALVKEWGEVVRETAPMVSADLMRFDPDLALEDGSPPPLSEEDQVKAVELKKALAKKEKIKEARAKKKQQG